ncbi:NEDD8-activating enzyme E1 catalytic subunit-like [Patiria miniata]|uniref:NEDD8-activating enzyme E1 catalytic subunit n=1 Tax=Patiria miniata TaxID=46514 RepID=A0A914AW47_PATMI|nr:NEDD8-activating enzyme E1 catalytic subunit-like [Patiria miniata]
MTDQGESVAMETGRAESDWPGRWTHVRKVLERSGPFAHPDFEPSTEILDFMLNNCRILVVGAGGLGCEILKDLALMGFRQIDVIDMDTIDLSNLNRQFLFRLKDVGKPKANVAADFINQRIPGCNVTPHFKKIQDYDDTFYRQFHIVINGLDSIVARRWMNSMMLSLVNYEDGAVDPTSIVPMIDGGTEGFKGNARVILPGMTACVECTLELYPPQITFPMCTIAHTPRLPAHCIEYVKVLLWPQEEPFGKDVAIDGDDPTHIQWIFEKAQERADQFNIMGVTYRLTQGVVKHIIPAVASTNATIAAQCVTEAFKIASSCCGPLNNYMVFNDTDGLYTYTFEAEKKEDCVACSQVPQVLTLPEDATLQNLIDHLTESASLQMKAPGITTIVNGKNKTLYMQNPEAIRVRTKENLPKKLTELGLAEKQELVVADITAPNALIFSLSFK